jgi:hypothetical protein
MTNLTTYHSGWARVTFSGPWPVAALDWCYEQFGEEQLVKNDSSQNNKWVYCGQRSFEFEREEDAVLFSLRWS